MVAISREPESNVAKVLRLSITGECNLACFYCRSLGKSRDLFTAKSPIQPSDVTKLVKIVGDLGVTHVVIGGGEPLLRKDAANFVKSAYAHKSIQEVRLVTNGTFLKAYADSLRKMGLRKVDVNFDSLNFMKYQRITGRDNLYRVLDGIEKIEKLNYPEIRLNILLLNGINEAELIDFARMTKDRKIHLRFLEYRPPFPNADPYADRLGMSVVQAKRSIDNFQKLTPIHDLESEIQIPTFQFQAAAGKISFLSEMEIDTELAVPRILFNADGVLSNEQTPQKTQPILENLRRDAKEDRLHRMIERIMAVDGSAAKKKAGLRIQPTAMARGSRATKTGQAAARR